MPRQRFALASVVFGALLLGACNDDDVFIPADGDVHTEVITMSAFDRLEVRDAFQVRVVDSNWRVMTMECVEELEPYVMYEVNDGWLEIGLDPDYTYDFEDPSHTVDVGVPYLTEVVADGATVEFDHFYSPQPIRLEATRKGVLMGDITATEVELDVEGADVRMTVVPVPEAEPKFDDYPPVQHDEPPVAHE